MVTFSAWGEFQLEQVRMSTFFPGGWFSSSIGCSCRGGSNQLGSRSTCDNENDSLVLDQLTHLDKGSVEESSPTGRGDRGGFFVSGLLLLTSAVATDSGCGPVDRLGKGAAVGGALLGGIPRRFDVLLDRFLRSWFSSSSSPWLSVVVVVVVVVELLLRSLGCCCLSMEAERRVGERELALVVVATVGVVVVATAEAVPAASACKAEEEESVAGVAVVVAELVVALALLRLFLTLL